MAKIKVGTVTSCKMQKTIVVKVDATIRHPLYKKLIKVSKKIKAHDEIGVKVGQKVKIIETKPYSRDVNFKVVEVTS